MNKKSSIVNLSKRLFKYNDQDPQMPDPDPTRSDKFFENFNEILLISKTPSGDPQTTKQDPPFFQCILSLMVLFFLCSGGFFGPFYLLVTAGKLVKIFWRQLMTSFLLIPIAFCERRLDIKHDMSKEKIAKTVFLGFLHAIWSISFGLSVNYTSMLHVYLLNSLDIVFLSIWRGVMSKRLAKLEVIGVIGMVISLILVLIDKSDNILFKGDLIALVAGLLFAIYAYNLEKYELNSPFWLCSLLISIFSSLFLMIISGIFDGTWDFNEETGVFGLFTQNWFFIHIIISLSAGIFYFNFLNVLKKHYQETVVRFLINVITILAGFINYFLGFGAMPCVLALVAAGIAIAMGFLIIAGKKNSEGLEFEFNKEESEEDNREKDIKKTDVFYMEMKIKD